jgi:hypothetical protein
MSLRHSRFSTRSLRGGVAHATRVPRGAISGSHRRGAAPDLTVHAVRPDLPLVPRRGCSAGAREEDRLQNHFQAQGKKGDVMTVSVGELRTPARRKVGIFSLNSSRMRESTLRICSFPVVFVLVAIMIYRPSTRCG